MEKNILKLRFEIKKCVKLHVHFSAKAVNVQTKLRKIFLKFLLQVHPLAQVYAQQTVVTL